MCCTCIFISICLKAPEWGDVAQNCMYYPHTIRIEINRGIHCFITRVMIKLQFYKRLKYPK